MTSIRSEPQMSLEAGALQALTAVNRGQQTILLVEDEDFVRHVTCEVLTFAGYRVLCARHAAEAGRVFRQNEKEVRLLLTDVVLPGRNGHNLARDLRALQPALKTVFISGYPENDLTKQAQQEPGVIYLPKPFSVDSLMRTVQQALSDLEAPALEPTSRTAAAGGSP